MRKITEISSRVAFVTGGGGSIGGAIARALAAEGARVAVCDILRDHANEVVDEIVAEGGEAIAIVCDQSDRSALRQAKAQVEQTLGTVTLLLAIAGAAAWGRLDAATDDDVDYMYDVNQMGVVDAIRTFAPDIARAGGGHVLGTASVSGLVPGQLPYHSLYTSAKLAVIGLMMAIEYELAETGIGTTVLIPSGVATKMAQNLQRYRPERFGGPTDGEIETPKKVQDIFAAQNRLWRPAEEVAEMVVQAIRENYPVIITDTVDREPFEEIYVSRIRDAFARAEAFDRGLGDRKGHAQSFTEMKAG